MQTSHREVLPLPEQSLRLSIMMDFTIPTLQHRDRMLFVLGYLVRMMKVKYTLIQSGRYLGMTSFMRLMDIRQSQSVQLLFRRQKLLQVI